MSEERVQALSRVSLASAGQSREAGAGGGEAEVGLRAEGGRVLGHAGPCHAVKTLVFALSDTARLGKVLSEEGRNLTSVLKGLYQLLFAVSP